VATIKMWSNLPAGLNNFIEFRWQVRLTGKWSKK